MRILAICAKDVGLECLRYLLREFPGDSYEFLVGEPGADAIAAELEKERRPCRRVSDVVLSEMAASGRKFDWLLNLWGGTILRREHLAMATNSLNIHPSLLPYGRGRDSVVWAVRHGHPAGASLHAITEGVDEGPIWSQDTVDYAVPVTGGELYARVVERCAGLFKERWPELRSGTAQAKPQGAAPHRTFRRKDLLADRVLDWDGDPQVREVVSRILAHDFGPGYSAQIRIGGKLYSARLDLAPATDDQQSSVIK